MLIASIPGAACPSIIAPMRTENMEEITSPPVRPPPSATLPSRTEGDGAGRQREQQKTRKKASQNTKRRTSSKGIGHYPCFETQTFKKRCTSKYAHVPQALHGKDGDENRNMWSIDEIFFHITSNWVFKWLCLFNANCTLHLEHQKRVRRSNNTIFQNVEIICTCLVPNQKARA